MAILYISWMMISFVLAIPYTFLANGDFNHLKLTVCLAPFIAMFLVFSWIKGKEEDGRQVFWIALVFLNLPILFRYVSVGLNKIGYSAISKVVFEARYLIIPGIIGFLLFIRLAIEAFRDLKSKSTKKMPLNEQ